MGRLRKVPFNCVWRKAGWGEENTSFSDRKMGVLSLCRRVVFWFSRLICQLPSAIQRRIPVQQKRRKRAFTGSFLL